MKSIEIPIPINLGKKTEEKEIKKEEDSNLENWTLEENVDMMDPTTDFEFGEEPHDYRTSNQLDDIYPEDLDSVEYVQVDPSPQSVPSVTTVASTSPEDTYVVNPIQEQKKTLFFSSKREKWIFLIFITPPFVISFISMLHMVSLFETSNLYWMAVTTAIAVELAAMSSLVALVTLNKLNRTTIWSIFGVLAGLQILGNMYHAFINMSITEINSVLTLLALENTPWALRLVMFLVSGILPVISLTFVKGIVDYFKEK